MNEMLQEMQTSYFLSHAENADYDAAFAHSTQQRSWTRQQNFAIQLYNAVKRYMDGRHTKCEIEEFTKNQRNVPARPRNS